MFGKYQEMLQTAFTSLDNSRRTPQDVSADEPDEAEIEEA
jgi:hypothetical protein